MRSAKSAMGQVKSSAGAVEVRVTLVTPERRRQQRDRGHRVRLATGEVASAADDATGRVTHRLRLDRSHSEA